MDTTRKRKHVDSPEVAADSRKVSLSDLPNELLFKIVIKLDFRTRIRLALNTRLDQFLGTVPNEIGKMSLEIVSNDHYHMAVSLGPQAVFTAEKVPTDTLSVRRRRMEMAFEEDERFERDTEPGLTAIFEIAGLDKRLRRWAQNTAVGRFELDVENASHPIIHNVVEAVFQFNANELVMKMRPQFTLHLPDFSLLLVMAQKMRQVSIGHTCTNLEAMDLFIIRNTMLKGECKLENFKIFLTGIVVDDFLKTCFGVEVHRTKSRVHLRNDTIKYEVESVKPDGCQLYSRTDFPEVLFNFNDNLWTKVEENHISFCKSGTDEECNDLKFKNLKKIEFGRTYVHEWISNLTYTDE